MAVDQYPNGCSHGADAPVFPCFAKGTLIETEIGPLPIETLRAGDKVSTLSSGLRVLRQVIKVNGGEAPVLVPCGALGNFRDLWLHPLACLILNDLPVPASEKAKTAHYTRPALVYIGLVFDKPEVVFAEGIPCLADRLQPMVSSERSSAA